MKNNNIIENFDSLANELKINIEQDLNNISIILKNHPSFLKELLQKCIKVGKLQENSKYLYFSDVEDFLIENNYSSLPHKQQISLLETTANLVSHLCFQTKLTNKISSDSQFLVRELMETEIINFLNNSIDSSYNHETELLGAHVL